MVRIEALWTGVSKLAVVRIGASWTAVCKLAVVGIRRYGLPSLN